MARRHRRCRFDPGVRRRLRGGAAPRRGCGRVAPDATFDRVNVRGTRHIVREAKRAGEKIVRGFDGDWVIVRPGSVYGPGDDQIQVYGRAANVVDFVAMRTVGDFVQSRAWQAVVNDVVRAAGGEARDGVKSEFRLLSEDEARSVESWLDAVVTKLKREEVAR